MGKCCSRFRAQFCPTSSSAKATISLPLVPPRKPDPKPEGPGELPKPPTADENLPSNGVSPDEEVLVVQSVEQLVVENSLEHFTSEYDIVHEQPPTLVLRRGFPFKLKLHFNRPFDKEKDVVCLVFTAEGAKNPSYAQGTMIFAPIVPDEGNVLPSDGWQTKIVENNQNQLTIKVTSTANTIVGEWSLDVDTKIRKEREEDAKSLRYTLKSPIFILFNPWCQQDVVYLADSNWKNEYVLNESGMIWRGTKTSLRPCIWNFGQFDPQVLECCCYLLSHVGKFSVAARSDPVKVVRHITSAVNSPDDNGVLVGNWSGDYGGGQSPTSWSGSVSILQQFYKSKKPVKYGQCWVFSGVCTTVCRALGIPTRSVTNFGSAHDTNNSLTIDYFFDDEGDPLEDLNVDSVWNFHVWNEVWMERPDLEPGGYGGWQAIDSTPQEESDGKYRCGPSSLVAIKRGEVQKAFDSPFLFAEVNADKVYWRYRGKNNPLKLIQKKTDEIGCFISTKAIGSYDRVDITNEYKYKEHTNDEREVMLRALRQCRNAFSRYYLNDNFEDVQFDFELLDDIVIGSPFAVKLSVKNQGREGKPYVIKGTLRVDTTLYTGEIKNMVKKHKFEVTVPERTAEIVTLNVNFNDYEKALVDQAAFNIAAMASVVETGFDYFAQDDFRVRKPDIKMEIEGDITQGEEFQLTARLRNPLPRTLKKSFFIIDGPGLGKPVRIPLKGHVEPESEASVTCKLRPKTSGEKSIAAKFWSKELDDVDGYKVIQIKPSPVSSADKEDAAENAVNDTES